MPDWAAISVSVATILACLDALTTKRLPPLIARVLMLLVAVVLLIRAAE